MDWFGSAPFRYGDPRPRGGGFGPLSAAQQWFYQDQPKYAWGQLGDQAGVDPNSAFGNFLQARYPDVFSGYVNASMRDPQLQATDYLAGRFGRMGAEFGLQSAQRRGEQPERYGLGRYVG